MSPLLLLAALSTSSANTEVFSGLWRLDEANSDYIPAPDLPSVAEAAGVAGSPRQTSDGSVGGPGGSAAPNTMVGPRGGGSPSTVSAQVRKAQATRWLIKSGAWLELDGQGNELEIGWRGNAPVSVSVRNRAHRMDTDEIGAPGKGKIRLAARWQPGELEITREVYGIVLIEHILPPEDDRLVVIVEIEPLVTGMDSLWFRREYVRTTVLPSPDDEDE